MAELFQTTQQNVSLHIQNILEENELTVQVTHKKFLSVQKEENAFDILVNETKVIEDKSKRKK